MGQKIPRHPVLKADVAALVLHAKLTLVLGSGLAVWMGSLAQTVGLQLRPSIPRSSRIQDGCAALGPTVLERRSLLNINPTPGLPHGHKCRVRGVEVTVAAHGLAFGRH